jgi:hypothetical protein
MTDILVGGRARALLRAPEQHRSEAQPFLVYEGFATELHRLLKSRNADMFALELFRISTSIVQVVTHQHRKGLQRA